MNQYDYFAMAQNHAHNNYSNYDGWNGLTDQYNYMANAGVGVPSNANPSDSIPYVFTIANSTTDDVSNVLLLGANTNTVGATNNGNNAAITITYQNASITYAQLLENIKSQPFKVGLTQLQCTANTTQPYVTITIYQLQANGAQLTQPVVPAIDPNQNQLAVTNVRYKYTVNAWTYLSFQTIYASTTLTVKMYPMEEVNISRGIDGREVIKNYGAPDMSQLMLNR